MGIGRYRPPQPKASPYITPQGYEALQRELSDLWKRRAETTKALAAAAAEGDRSENAEYIYRKKELRELDRRIRYLQKRLPNLTVVRAAPPNQHRVFFGAWVTLENEAGEIFEYRIVGADEINPQRGYISIDSPLVQAILKKELNDEALVDTPQGNVVYRLCAIRYPQPTSEV